MSTTINSETFTKVEPLPFTSTAKSRTRTETKVIETTGKPKAAGMLDLIVASWMIIGAWVIFANEPASGQFIYAALVCILICLFSMAAGVCSFMRKGWKIALIGSICAIPFIYGFISTILIIQSRNEFSRL